MKKIENVEKIGCINFECVVQPYCPLGGVYYNAEIDVDFTPGRYYFEYCEVNKKINELGGEKYTVEELVDKIFKIMMEFEPDALTVTVSAESSKHFPVRVSKDFYKD